MIHSAEVYMWGTRIGVVSANDSDVASFQYDKQFISSGIEISPLSMPFCSIGVIDYLPVCPIGIKKIFD